MTRKSLLALFVCLSLASIALWLISYYKSVLYVMEYADWLLYRGQLCVRNITGPDEPGWYLGEYDFEWNAEIRNLWLPEWRAFSLWDGTLKKELRFPLWMPPALFLILSSFAAWPFLSNLASSFGKEAATRTSQPSAVVSAPPRMQRRESRKPQAQLSLLAGYFFLLLSLTLVFAPFHPDGADYWLWLTLPFLIIGITGVLLVILGYLLAMPLWRTQEHPRCQKCGYSLHGMTEPRCPECGTRFDPERRPTKRELKRRARKLLYWSLPFLVSAILLAIPSLFANSLFSDGLRAPYASALPYVLAVSFAIGSVGTVFLMLALFVYLQLRQMQE
jgi:protein-S-isoprenylcysteine O-methyltransferase Ste14